jgi:hypothetical protein
MSIHSTLLFFINLETFCLNQLYEFDTYISSIANEPVVNQIYTSKGNQMYLDLNLMDFFGLSWFNCTWKFV